jgi:hypothetical protein
MPSALVEASFMSNPDEDMRLASLAYNKLEAKSIAVGVLNYFRATRNVSVDFTSLFAPLDDQAEAAQQIADATIVRKKVIEKRSLFGRRFEEVTYDATGRVISRRDIGGGSRSSAKATRVVAKGSEAKARVSGSAKQASSSSKQTQVQKKSTSAAGKSKVSSSASKKNSSSSSKSSKSTSAKKSSKK